MGKILLPRRRLLTLAAPALLLPGRARANPFGLSPPFLNRVRGNGGAVASPFINAATVGGTNGGTTTAFDSTGATELFAFITYSVGAVTTVVAGNPGLRDSNGNTWSSLTQKNSTSNGGSVIFHADNPTVGTGHTCTFDGSNSFSSLVFAAFKGVNLSSPFDVQNGNVQNSSATTIQTNLITTGSNGELVVSGVLLDTLASTASVDSGLTIPSSCQAPVSATAFGAYFAYLLQSTAAAINPTWALSAVTNALTTNIASFKP